ncbi:hypothetical protein CBM2600_B70392 [Cupriavidus taiwanensis]|nr:hypothetical protein CBM2600_B70392 [Cupriavidus taiwanensis]
MKCLRSRDSDAAIVLGMQLSF